MDYGKSFTYMFEDPNWLVKLLIFGVLSVIGSFTAAFLVGILILAIPLGYTVDVVRNVENGVTTPGQILPEWTDFGEKFATGIKLAIGLLVWLLPGIILYLLGSLITGAAANSSNGNTSGGGSLIGSCFFCLGGLYFLAFSVALPGIFIRFARTRELSSVFEFSQILNFTQANLSNVIVVVLLTLLVRFIGGLGVILCVVGLLITQPWAYLVEAHLYGQLARVAGIGSTGSITPMPPAPPMPPTPPAQPPAGMVS